MSLSFRWLGADDLAEWRRIRLEALVKHPSAFLTTAKEFAGEPDNSVRAKLAQGNLIGAWDGDRLVGNAAYLRLRRTVTKHRAEIGAVYVMQTHRGTGLAAQMMAQIDARAVAEGVTQLELHVETRNLAAIRFYEKLGFERFGTLPGVVKTEAGLNDDYLYVKRLGA